MTTTRPRPSRSARGISTVRFHPPALAFSVRNRTVGGDSPRERRRARAARVAGIATAALAGSLAVAVVAPQATVGVSRAVSLTTSPSWQPALDALLQAMQEVAARDAALPYAPPGSEAELMTLLQNTNYQLLSAGLSRVTELFNGIFFQSPEAVAGDAANPRQYFDFFTPDIYYRVTAGLAPGATYELTGSIGGGTEHFSISALAITAGTAQTQASLELGHGLVVNPNGTFTVTIGPTEPTGAVNFLNDSSATTDGAASLLVRDMLGDWAKGGGHVSLHCVSDCPRSSPSRRADSSPAVMPPMRQPTCPPPRSTRSTRC